LGCDAELLLDLGRQTGGPGIVASARAVLDGDRARRGHASSFRGHSTSRGSPPLPRSSQERNQMAESSVRGV
jgi:hypothetical protein